MATNDPVESTIKSVIDQLKKANKIDLLSYSKRIHDQILGNSNLAFLGLQSMGTNAFADNKNKINGKDCSDLLTRLGTQSIIHALSTLDGSSDPQNLRDDVYGNEADEGRVDSLCRLFHLCYEDYVNKELSSIGHSLEQLKGDEAFKTAFKARMTNPTEELINWYRDYGSSSDTSNNSVNMAFLSNYLFYDVDGLTYAASDLWSRPVGIMSSAVIDKHSEKDALARAMHRLTSSYTVHAVTRFGSKNRMKPTTKDELAKVFQDPHVQKAPNMNTDKVNAVKNIQLSDAGLQDWSNLADAFVGHWTANNGTWKVAVGRAAGNVVSEDWKQENRDIKVISGMTTWDDVRRYTRGKALQDFLKDVYNQSANEHGKDYLKQQSSRSVSGEERIPRSLPGQPVVAAPMQFFSCFVPGTRVATKDGLLAIEELREGEQVLVNGEDQSWGAVSGERVTVQVANPILYGFNDEKPFFTAGHVFHTTTGPRAIDPVSASLENPWEIPGHLLVGHRVQMWDPASKSYAQITVEKITSEIRHDICEVFDVHMSDGSRTYHANGYLVAVNYPEITTKQVATLLSTMDSMQQIQVLSELPELSQHLRRFDRETLVSSLNQELGNRQAQITAQHYVQRKKTGGASRPSQMKRTFALEPIDEGELAVLPSLVAYEGVIALDGVICNAVHFDDHRQQLSWSRQLKTGLYEHAQLTLDEFCMWGNGTLVTSPLLHDPQSNPMAKTIHFRAIVDTYASDILATAAAVGNVTAHYEGNKAWIQDEQSPLLISDVAPSSVELAAFEEVKSEDSLIHNQNNPTARQVATPDASIAPATNVIQEPVLGPAVIETVREAMVFDMSFDSTPLVQNQNTFKDEQSYGKIEIGAFREKKTELPRTLLLVKLLDQLLFDINSAHASNPEVPALDALYSSTLWVGGDRNFHANLDLLDAGSLIQMADDIPDVWDGSYTFKKQLNSNVKLPILWQEINLIIDLDEHLISGTLTEFDAASTTHLGKSHYFSNKTGSAFGQSGAAARGTMQPTGVKAKPASVATGSVIVGDQTELVKLTALAKTYSDQDVLSASGKIFNNVMYYHMDEKQRTDLLGVNAVPDLSDALALGGQMTQTNKDWIKNTYAPAYIAYIFAQNPPKEYRDEAKFDDKEKGKILNFWHGTGDKTLFSSPEYHEINKLCARQAVLMLYPVIKDFVNLDGPKYATALANHVGRTLAAELRLDPVAKETNKINMWSNILYGLDPTGDHTSELYAAICSEIIDFAMNKPAAPGMAEEWVKPLEEAMLREIFLKGSDPADEKAKDALRKDLEELTGKTQAELRAMSLDQQRLQIIGGMRLGKDLPKAVTGARTLFTGIRRWIRGPNAPLMHRGGDPINISTKAGKWQLGCAALMLIGSIATAFVAGSKLNDAQIGELATDIARQAFNVISPFYVKRDVPRILINGNPPAAQAAAANRQLAAQGRNVGRNGVLRNRPGAGGGVRPAAPVQGNNANGLRNAANAVQQRRGISIKAIKGINACLGLAFVAFSAWDLAIHWKEMSGTQRAFGVLQVGLLFVVAVLEILEIFIPAVAWIPVVGAICAVAALVVGILIMFVIGDREPQKPPLTTGENWIVGKKKDVANWPDPPAPLLTYTITKPNQQIGAVQTLVLTAKNESGKDLVLVPPEEIKDKSDEDFTAADKEQWCKTSFTVPCGTDTSCWFETGKMEIDTSNPSTKNTAGKVYLESDSDVQLRPQLLQPDGIRPELTSQQFSAFAPLAASGDTNHKILAQGKSIVMTFVGKLNVKGETVLQVSEGRPGIAGCVKVFTFSRS